MFILYQKRQFINPKKVNSPPIQFGHVTCHVTIINGCATRRPQELLLAKKKIPLVLAILAKDITNQSLFSEHTLDLCQA